MAAMREKANHNLPVEVWWKDCFMIMIRFDDGMMVPTVADWFPTRFHLRVEPNGLVRFEITAKFIERVKGLASCVLHAVELSFGVAGRPKLRSSWLSGRNPVEVKAYSTSTELHKSFLMYLLRTQILIQYDSVWSDNLSLVTALVIIDWF